MAAPGFCPVGKTMLQKFWTTRDAIMFGEMIPAVDISNSVLNRSMKKHETPIYGSVSERSNRLKKLKTVMNDTHALDRTKRNTFTLTTPGKVRKVEVNLWS